jgi:hypothetical protein
VRAFFSREIRVAITNGIEGRAVVEKRILEKCREISSVFFWYRGQSASVK